MRQNSLKQEDVYAMSPGREQTSTADDLIDQLVQQIVDAAGVADTASPAETISRIDLVQAHIEQLREGLHEQLEETAGAAADLEDDEPPEPEVVALPAARRERRQAVGPRPVPAVEPIRSVRSRAAEAGRVAARPSQPAGTSRGVPRRPAAEDVILQAIAASGGDAAPAITRSANGEPPRRGPGSGRVQWMLLGMVLAVIIGGGIVVMGKSFFSNVSDLLENYWIEEEPPTEISSLTPVPAEVPTASATRPVTVAAASEPQRLVPDEAPTEPLAQGVAETRRTVKTFRVGPDGKILFGPRAGS